MFQKSSEKFGQRFKRILDHQPIELRESFSIYPNSSILTFEDVKIILAKYSFPQNVIVNLCPPDKLDNHIPLDQCIVFHKEAFRQDLGSHYYASSKCL